MYLDLPAYFITFTCYGTWLHGDQRGSTLKRSKRLNYALSPNSQRQRFNRDSLRHAPVTLNAAMRDVVETAIREACAFKSWSVLALNVRTNHVHLVVVAPTVAPDRVVSTVKARATFRLREAGLTVADAAVWCEGGSKRWLNDQRSVDEACRYVIHGQGPDLD
ncbi:MAG: transposase [Dehalococcoidia bacterium]